MVFTGFLNRNRWCFNHFSVNVFAGPRRCSDRVIRLAFANRSCGELLIRTVLGTKGRFLHPRRKSSIIHCTLEQKTEQKTWDPDHILEEKTVDANKWQPTSDLGYSQQLGRLVRVSLPEQER